MFVLCNHEARSDVQMLASLFLKLKASAQGLNNLAARTTPVIISVPATVATTRARPGTQSRQAPTNAQVEKGR